MNSELQKSQAAMRPPSQLLRSKTKWLILLCLAAAGLLLVLRHQSESFRAEAQAPPPLVSVELTLFALQAVYVIATFLIFGNRQSSKIHAAILIGTSIIFRALLWSTPLIQEVDIYRYILDGRGSRHGISPFAFTPAEIEQSYYAWKGDHNDPVISVAQPLLQEFSDSSAAFQELQAVHFKEIPTIYPPTSQWIFWLSSCTANFLHADEVLTMKAWLIGFDLATLTTILILLRRLGLPLEWIVLYGWSPLVLKEVANSGHLDSIAAFFTIATFAALAPNRNESSTTTAEASSQHASAPKEDLTLEQQIAPRQILLAAVFFGLAIMAKVFPIVLLPPIVCHLARARNSKRDLRSPFLFVIAAILTMVATCLPALWLHWPNSPTTHRKRSPLEGLVIFSKDWEMNCLVYMLVESNLRPDKHYRVDANSLSRDPLSEQPIPSPHSKATRPWFVILPNGARTTILDSAAELFPNQDTEDQIAALSRILLRSVLCLLIAYFSICVYRTSDFSKLLEIAFLILVWSWLLSPVQNPWYLVWALPLLPFSRHPRYYAFLFGLPFLYYLRFWLETNYPTPSPACLSLTGIDLFDYYLVWVQHLPLLLFTLIHTFPRSSY